MSFIPIWKHTNFPTRVFFLSSFSRNSDDQLSSNFHRLVILCICWGTPSEKTCLWQLPIVSSVFMNSFITSLFRSLQYCIIQLAQAVLMQKCECTEYLFEKLLFLEIWTTQGLPIQLIKVSRSNKSSKQTLSQIGFCFVMLKSKY